LRSGLGLGLGLLGLALLGEGRGGVGPAAAKEGAGRRRHVSTRGVERHGVGVEQVDVERGAAPHAQRRADHTGAAARVEHGAWLGSGLRMGL
jgi:hypothetical protein